MATLEKMNTVERTAAAECTGLRLVNLKRGNSMPEGNWADMSFDQNVTQPKWESLKKTTHVASGGHQRQTKHSKSSVE